MNRHQVAAAMIAAAFVAGCATSGAPPAERAEDKAYMTGSRLPLRDNSANAAAAAIADKNPNKGIKDDLIRGAINPVKTSN